MIPEDWEVKPLGELAKFITSGSRGWAAFYADAGALFIRSQNIGDGALDFDDTQFVRPPRGAEGNRTKVELNDILITITGNSVGNVAAMDRAIHEAYISQHVGLVRLKKPNMSPYVCRYLAPNAPGNPQIAGSQSGQSKPGLNLQNLRDFKVASPMDEAEQRAIAEALSDVDGLLGGLDRLIAKKRDLKQAAMQQLLTAHIRLPGFHGEWVEKSLGEMARIEKGQQLHSTECHEHGTVPHYNGGTEPSGFTDRSNTAGETIAISEGGNSCGYVHFIARPFWCGGHCYALTPLGVEKPFLYHALKARQSAIMGLRVGSGLPNVQKTALTGFRFAVPVESAEQTAIAEVLSEMDAELDALERRREKTRALKQAMMQQLLTGQIRLVTPGSARP
jgi:type I restriction enzyme S subunit